MPGISELYITFANDHIEEHEHQGTLHEISRAQVESTILACLDEASLDIDYKISWYHAILNTPLFDSLWFLTAIKNCLPPACTQRYIPDQALFSYEVPASYIPSPAPDPQSSASPTRYSKSPQHHHKRLDIRADIADEDESATYYIPTNDEAALAGLLGCNTKLSSTTNSNPRNMIPSGLKDDIRISKAKGPILDAKGLIREEGDDGDWRNPQSRKKQGALKRAGGRTRRRLKSNVVTGKAVKEDKKQKDGKSKSVRFEDVHVQMNGQG